jgi:protein-disulfide isomerase
MNLRRFLANSLQLLVFFAAACSPSEPKQVAGGGSIANVFEESHHCQVQGLPHPVYNPHEASWGSKDAAVTIAVFSDLQCPYCAEAHETLNAVRAKYGPRRIRVIWKHHPLAIHDQARMAAEAAQGVFELSGSKAFFDFIGIAYHHQSEFTPANMAAWATKAGVKDLAAFQTGLQTHRWGKKIDEDIELAESLDIQATPTFMLNGVMLRGAHPMQSFDKALPILLSQARMFEEGGKTPNATCTLTQINMDKLAEGQPKPAMTLEPTVYRVPVGDSPSQGPEGAPVTLAVFSDYQCPYCRKADKTISRLKKQYKDKLRIVWKNNPLGYHEYAEPAAQLAQEAFAQQGNAGFWKVHQRLFEQAPKLDNEQLMAIAKEFQLDTDKVKSAIHDHRYMDKLEADGAVLLATGTTGAPIMFLNGRKIEGAKPFPLMKSAIDAEVQHVSSSSDWLSDKQHYYEKLVAKGAVKPYIPHQRKLALVPGVLPEVGPKSAPVVLDVYAGFLCKSCRTAPKLLNQVRSKYGNKIALRWHVVPVSPEGEPSVPARLAAEAAHEVFKRKGEKAFWSYVENLYEHQEDPHAFEQAWLESQANAVGVKAAWVHQALQSHIHTDLMFERALQAIKLGVLNRVMIVANNYTVPNPMLLTHLTVVIDYALEQAAKQPVMANLFFPIPNPQLLTQNITLFTK